MSNWKCYINYGYQSEYDVIDKASFKTKQEARDFCKEHKLPLKCIMREEEWKSRKNSSLDIVIG